MNKLIMMVGLPGSGKSYYAQKLSQQENAVIYSSDEMRKQLFGDINEQNKNQQLFQEIHKRIKNDLQIGKNVIYDATNTHHRRRRAFLQMIAKTNCVKECYFVATPYEKCIEQNNNRDRKVPTDAIEKMYKSIYIPQKYEGWDKINIIWNFDDQKYNITTLFEGESGLDYISQDNKHHRFTIGKHCKTAMFYLSSKTGDKKLNMAALLHDIGKRETKVFHTIKGIPTKEAHYYGHNFVSAYNAMFYLKSLGYSDEDILDICNYIQWHMQPFFMKTEKAKRRFLNLVGKDFYDKLMLLHEADKQAK